MSDVLYGGCQFFVICESAAKFFAADSQIIAVSYARIAGFI